MKNMWKSKKEPWNPGAMSVVHFTDRNHSKIRMALTFDVLKNRSLFHYEEDPVFMHRKFQ
jgi:hypothetical protein